MHDALDSPAIASAARRWASRTPDQTAFVFCEAGAERARISFACLAQAIKARAQELSSHAMPGERAMVAATATPEFVVDFFACLDAGIVAVPVPAGNRQRTAAIAADCSPRLVIEDGIIAVQARASGPAGTDVAVLQYTSGSTAEPRGVMLSHANLTANAGAIANVFGCSQSTVVVSWLPMFHDMGLIIGAILGPICGGTAVLMPPDDFLIAPRRWPQAIHDYRGTVSGAPNLGYELISDPAATTWDLSCWQVAFCGSEPVRPTVLDDFAKAMHPYGFAAESLLPAYGLAEATLMVSGGPAGRGPQRFAADAAALAAGRLSAGTTAILADLGAAAPSTTIEIRHPVSGDACPPGVTGEVIVTGPGVAAGYWGNPAATAETFVRTPAGTVQLRTGDLGTLVDSHLYVTGRIKDVLIIGGQNVYPQDLEHTARQAAPAIRRLGCAAFAEPGDDSKITIVAELGPHHWPDGLSELIRDTIWTEHRVAIGRIVLVRPGVVPKTSSGKIRRSACRTALAEHRLPIIRDWAPTGACAQGDPWSPDEEQIASICQDVLGVSPARRDEDLALLGGGSLGTLRLVNEINRRLGRSLGGATAFDNLTVAGLAAATSAEVTIQQVPEHRADTLADAVLDPAIRPPADASLASAARPRDILLTGATGFVGAFTLTELLHRTSATIHCPVRARDDQAAQERIGEAARLFGRPVPARDRVLGYAADLSQPQFGLSNDRYADLALRVDTIINSAASVSAVQAYATMRGVNVTGTQEVLRFAVTERLKRVHHLSTVAVLLAAPSDSPRNERRVTEAPGPAVQSSGYWLSKYVAEQLIYAASDRGVPAVIYRLARVSGDTTTGAWAEGDFWRNVIHGSLMAGVLPATQWVDCFTPVDYVAAVLTELILTPQPADTIYHIADQPMVTINDIAAWLGGIPRVSWPQWLRKVSSDPANPMSVLAPHLRQGETGPAADILASGTWSVDCSNLRRALHGSSVSRPAVDAALFARYASRMPR